MIENCNKKNEALFGKIKNEMFIEIPIKKSRVTERVNLVKFDSVLDDIKGKEIKEFRIMLVKDFSKKFLKRSPLWQRAMSPS